MANPMQSMAARPTLDKPCAGRRVVICEDHAITRWGLREYCRKLGCDVVGETSFGAEAIDLVSSYCPALLILDQNLPGELDGRAVHRVIRERKLPTKVLVITSYCDSASFFNWIQQPDGPDGVLSKITSVLEIETALIRLLTTDTKYIPESIWNKEQRDARNPLGKLAPHELRVLRDVAEGYRLGDIARRQHLTASTVRSYMNAIYCKLELPCNTLHGAALVYQKWVTKGSEADVG
jgi:two-component system, NarL family, response regulator DesR